MDEVIFEEFKGTGNQEVLLERKLADRRIYPAINIMRSGTRREELLTSEEDLQKLWILRKLIGQMEPIEAMEFMMDRLKTTKTNMEFFDMMKQG
jgi:transcription termination factor Rho